MLAGEMPAEASDWRMSSTDMRLHPKVADGEHRAVVLDIQPPEQLSGALQTVHQRDHLDHPAAGLADGADCLRGRATLGNDVVHDDHPGACLEAAFDQFLGAVFLDLV